MYTCMYMCMYVHMMQFLVTVSESSRHPCDGSRTPETNAHRQAAHNCAVHKSICMCVMYIHMSMYIYIYICTCVHMYVYKNVCI